MRLFLWRVALWPVREMKELRWRERERKWNKQVNGRSNSSRVISMKERERVRSVDKGRQGNAKGSELGGGRSGDLRKREGRFDGTVLNDSVDAGPATLEAEARLAQRESVSGLLGWTGDKREHGGSTEGVNPEIWIRACGMAPFGWAPPPMRQPYRVAKLMKMDARDGGCWWSLADTIVVG